MENKRFPWWKHYIDFEDTDLVAEMRRRENGDSIALFYYWLISFTANTDGVLSYEFGKAVKPCDLEYLARKSGRNIEVIKATLGILKEAQILDTVEMGGVTFQRLNSVGDFLGKAESTRPEAIRQRRKRERDKLSRDSNGTCDTPSRIKEIEEEKEIEEDIRDRDKRKSEEKTQKRTRSFQKPTLEELKAYIKEKGYTFDAEQFIAHYDSNGWHVGKSPMKSWKAACVTWQSNEPKAATTNEERAKLYEAQAKKGGW